jgi:peroxiredoxin
MRVMRQHTGNIAPDFRAKTWEGIDVNLADYRGQKVWLAFFRYAACPLCNLQVRAIIRKHDELKAQGVQVLAVFQSPAESMAEYVAGQNPPFPLISDPSESLYALYGLENSKKALFALKNVPALAKAAAAGFMSVNPEGTIDRIPADFLIDESGKITDVFYGETIGDHIGMDRVERFAARATA